MALLLFLTLAVLGIRPKWTKKKQTLNKRSKSKKRECSNASSKNKYVEQLVDPPIPYIIVVYFDQLTGATLHFYGRFQHKKVFQPAFGCAQYPVQGLNLWPGVQEPERYPLSGGALLFWGDSTSAIMGDVIA